MLYNVPHFPPNDTTAFLLAVARAKGRLRKGGVPDLEGTARSILRDWVAGRIAYYTAPPSAEATAQLKSATAGPDAGKVGTVDAGDVGGASLHAAFAPAFDLGALFGEADAVAFASGGEGTAGSALAGGTKAVKMREGALGVESEEADVGWAVEDEQPKPIEVDDDDLDLDDLVDDEVDGDEDEDEDDDMSEDEPMPAPTGVKGKRAAPAPRSASQIVSVAPPNKKKKQAKSVSFSSTPLGPTGSTSASAPSAASANAAQIAEEAGAVSVNKKAKRDAKKDKKRAAKAEAKLRDEVKQATREFGDDVELPSGPRKAQTVKGKGAVGGAYDFSEFFDQKKGKKGADDDDVDM